MSYHPSNSSVEILQKENVYHHDENEIDQNYDSPEGEELSTIIQEQEDSVLREEIKDNGITTRGTEVLSSQMYITEKMKKKENNDGDDDDGEFSVDGEIQEYKKRVQQMNKKGVVFRKAISKYRTTNNKENNQSSEQPSHFSSQSSPTRKRDHFKFLKNTEVLESRLRKRSREKQDKDINQMTTRNSKR